MDTPPRRSDPARAAILAAGRQRFSRDGFSATTVRAIAADAGTDPSLVIRYFGSKQGLFEATTKIELDLPDFSEVPRSRLGIAVVTKFLERWEGTAGDPLRVLLTSATTDRAGAKQMREIFRHQVHPAVAGAAHDQQEHRVTLVASTIIGLAMSRYVLQLPGVAELNRDQVIDLYGPVIQRQLTGRL